MMNRSTVFYVLALALTSTSAMAFCFVLYSVACCEALPPTALKPNLSGPCPDSITDNPVIQVARSAAEGEQGNIKKTIFAQRSCTWDDYVINENGHCVFVGTQNESCTENGVSGPACSGIAP